MSHNASNDPLTLPPPIVELAYLLAYGLDDDPQDAIEEALRFLIETKLEEGGVEYQRMRRYLRIKRDGADVLKDYFGYL